MVIPTQFELDSIQDQLALIKSLISHIDMNSEGFREKELDEDFERLLQKMDKSATNLSEKYKELKKLLNN